MYLYKKEASICMPVEDVFAYYTNMFNISVMVPGNISVKVLKGSGNLKKGDRIKLLITIFGVSFLWESVIEDYVRNVKFTDRMTRGPFKKWVHKHQFAKSAGGTTLTDIIEYDMPLGIFGQVANRIFVRNMIDNIFIFRHNFDIKCEAKVEAGLSSKEDL